MLDNARKHGGSHVRVRVWRDAGLVTVRVEDDGPGIDPSDLPRIFTPFARGRDAAPDEQHGVGLGLYLVSRIAQAHGGAAFAENLRAPRRLRGLHAA